jgi:ribosomal protein S18 acetylase RimI-like enzyme
VTADPPIHLRNVRDDDEQFLIELYAGTRAAEVAAFGWDQARIDAFLKMQFCVRQQAYRMQFPNADHSVIEFDGLPAGSLIVDRSKERISLTDIAVLPGFRGRGIASQIIRRLQAEATDSDRSMVLQVDKTNANALRLYQSLGFVIIADAGFTYEMTWPAPAPSSG